MSCIDHSSDTSTLQPKEPIPSGSNVRRKPIMTYRSPSRESIGPLSLTRFSHNCASSSSTPPPITLKISSSSSQLNALGASFKRKKYTMNPLPLYHPLGRLALSLPLLDPASVGLPTPVKSGSDDAIRRSSARAHRPAAKLRDVDDDGPVTTTNLPLHNIDVQEKPSPRKRRGGGGPKRKRREADDGDATYPAKRTRIPRGSVNQQTEEESPSESIAAEVTPTPEPMSEVPEDRKPERRSRRARGGKRRDSSVSDAASTASTGATAYPAKENESMEVEKSFEADAPPTVDEKNEKEEGELSEDGKSTCQS